MKIFCAGMVTETNGFVSRPTTLEDFTGNLFDGLSKKCPDNTLSFAAKTWEGLAEKRGYEFIAGLLAGAMPGGPTEKTAYEAMRDELLSGLRQAGTVDAVLLDLHGAMMAEGYLDVEGDIIENIRKITGPDIPIGVHLDLHCHLSQKMIDNSTIIITMKEWPHTDIAERATEVLDAIEGVIYGQLTPAMSLWDCRMIGCYPTTSPPMSEFVDRMTRLEKNENIISISLIHGFPYANNPDVGSKVLVITNNMPAIGTDIARDLARALWEIREQAVIRGHITVEEALKYASRPEKRPLVLSDQADSVAGGAPGDSTFLLRAFVDNAVENVVFGPIWDPVSVEQCHGAGEGAELLLHVGGKTGPESGNPVKLKVKVRKILAGLTQNPIGEIPSMFFGRAVWVTAQNDTDIILHAERAATFLPSVIEDFGIDLSRKSVIICKMWRHGGVAFAPVAGEIKVVTSAGAQTLDFSSIDYSAARHPFWPQNPYPFHNNDPKSVENQTGEKKNEQ